MKNIMRADEIIFMMYCMSVSWVVCGGDYIHLR